MTTPQPDHQRLTRQGRGDVGAFDTFTLRLPRWRFVRLLGRNPLIRLSDRIEALVLALAVVMVSVLAGPIAATVGAAVHDSQSRSYAEQAQNRHTVTATVTGDKFVRRDTFGQTVTVPARWFAAGAEHTGAVPAPPRVKTGDSVDIWVGEDGGSSRTSNLVRCGPRCSRIVRRHPRRPYSGPPRAMAARLRPSRRQR
jgi:hypothetical protein